MNELPAVGAPVERLRLDCKLLYTFDDEGRREMAKDIAAFANANGGRLLIGSKEVGGLIEFHRGLTAEHAAQTKREIDEAVRNWLTPRPIIDFPRPFALPDGNVVLVVDVQPYPGQPVGLQIDKADNASWKFPVRVGTNTVWYDPVEIVMLMDVAHRRKVQLLNAARGHPVDVLPPDVLVRGQNDVGWTLAVVELIAIDATSNAVLIEVHASDSGFGRVAEVPPEARQLWMSIDRVVSVWRNGDRWMLEIDGWLELAGQMGTTPTYRRRVR